MNEFRPFELDLEFDEFPDEGMDICSKCGSNLELDNLTRQCFKCRSEFELDELETSDDLEFETEIKRGVRNSRPRRLGKALRIKRELIPPADIARYFQIVIDGKFYDPPEGVKVKNFYASSVPKFKHWTRFKRGPVKRSSTITAVVIHETQTSSLQSTITTLKARGAGAHFVVAADGTVTQHGDLVKDYFKHANHYNCNSVGIEVVNPYNASRLKAPWTDTLTARWVKGRDYVVPTREQAETVSKLIWWLTKRPYGRLHIPRTWIGEQDGDFAMNRAPGTGFVKADRKCNRPARSHGILAHTNIYGSGHADGAWLVLYAYLRIERRFTPSKAYRIAVELSPNVRFKRFRGGLRGAWVKLPDEPSGDLPGDYSCVRPRTTELEVALESETTLCKVLPISPIPRPGQFYTIKHKVDGKGLINLAGRAYRVSLYSDKLRFAKHINSHVYNQRFWVRSKNMPSFPDGIISFRPRFTRDIKEQANANKGAAPRGHGFATIYIPKSSESL